MKRQRIYLYRDPTDEMKDVTICRNCGRVVEYGKLINNTGHDACPVCYESMRRRIEYVRANNYDLYRKSDHLYELNDVEYRDVGRIRLREWKVEVR